MEMDGLSIFSSWDVIGLCGMLKQIQVLHDFMTIWRFPFRHDGVPPVILRFFQYVQWDFPTIVNQAFWGTPSHLETFIYVGNCDCP